jgi:hypothetical protein
MVRFVLRGTRDEVAAVVAAAEEGVPEEEKESGQ